MVSQIVHGKEGVVKLSSTAILNVSSWKANVGAKIDEVTGIGDTWTKRMTGVKDITGSISCYLDPGDTTGQEVLRAAALGGSTQASLGLFVDATHNYSGSALLTMSVNVSQGAVSTVDFDFSSTGTWAYGP
jgi:hypothetical protein